MDRQERIDLAQWVLGKIIASGADQAAVSVLNNRVTELIHRDAQIDKLKESTGKSVYLQIYADSRYSEHGTNDLRKPALESFITEAVRATKYLSEDEYRALPDPQYYPRKMRLDLQLLDHDYNHYDTGQKVERIAQIEELARGGDSRVVSASAGFSDGIYESVRLHSNGFQGESRRTYFSESADVTVKDETGSLSGERYSARAHFLSDLPEARLIADTSVRRALWKIGQKQAPSGTYEMLVENLAAGKLVGLLTGAMKARVLQQKKSYLDGMLNKAVASPLLTVTDDPYIQKGLGSRFYDSDGIGAQMRVMINQGILRYYYIDNYYGRKLGQEPTAGDPSNLLIATGRRSVPEMLKDIKKGILITGFIGGNSNTTTGDFSFGIMGQLIENGQIVQPVNEMNISGNALSLWKSLVETGNDPHPYSSWKIPSLLFEGVDFSGS
ncbi:MAG: TldD/PmbA family protein [FCB group bacterium]|nr:TldD/PmbA family protein [FCB group bacterium]